MERDTYRIEVENIILEMGSIVRENRYLRKENERLKKSNEELSRMNYKSYKQSEEISNTILGIALKRAISAE